MRRIDMKTISVWFPNASNSSQVRMHPQSLNHRDNSCSQMFRGFGSVERDESMNFPRSCPRQW